MSAALLAWIAAAFGGRVAALDGATTRVCAVSPGLAKFSRGFDSLKRLEAVRRRIDASGDGTSALGFPRDVAVDALGSVYVAADGSHNVFKVTPGGVITEIIDAAGDGAGNTLGGPQGVTADGAGNKSHNAFKISGVFTPPPVPVPTIPLVGLVTLLGCLARAAVVVSRRRALIHTRGR